MKENYKVKRPREKSMLFGIHSVLEAIHAGKEIDKILLRRDMSSDLARQLMDALDGLPVPIQRLPVEKLNHFTEKNHQGVIAFISPISYQNIEEIVPAIYEEGRTPFLLVLDSVTDVRNFGAIARTAECAGVDAIIVPNRGGAAINADAIKTSAGALHTLPICRVENLGNCMKFLTASGIKTVAVTEKAEGTYTECNLTEPVALVMGSEDEGIDPNLLNLCKEFTSIPMSGKISSLNVSVAAGVLIYETIRQRSL